MSYRIDGETPYWGGLEVPCQRRISISSDVKEWKKAQEEALKSVTDGVVDYISEEMARAVVEAFEETRKACKEFGETANEILEKLEQMEKKKNKMTKAEAFEWLKCKKVDTIGLGEAVMKKLFDCGVKWANGKCEYYDFSDYLLIEHNGDLYHCGHCGEAYWRAHHFEEIYAQDILSMEIIDENKSEEEKALDKISCLGAQIVDILLRMKGHHHVTITETTVALHDEGMCLFHSDPF